MTTSRRGPQPGSWPLPVVVPVVSGNQWCWSFTRPTLHVFYNSEQPGKLHWFSITRFKLRREKKIIQACVCGLWRPSWWSVICQSDFYKSNLCLNWTDEWHERRAVLWSQAFRQIQAGHANIDNVCSLSPGSCPAKKHKLNCESSKPVQFLMVLTEVMSTELFKNSETGYSEISIIPVTHVTNIQHTVDTIAIGSFEDVRGFCLWLNPRCVQLPAALWVPLTVFLFPMDELCCVVVKSNCFKHPVILQRHSLESDLTLPILIFSLPLTETLTYHINSPASHEAGSIDLVTEVYDLWAHLWLELWPQCWTHKS